MTEEVGVIRVLKIQFVLLLVSTTVAYSATIIPWMATSYRYTTVTPGDSPGFEDPGFDDSGFVAGSAGFGNYSTKYSTKCKLESPTYERTYWPPKTDLLVRKAFTLSQGVRNLTVSIAVDNGAQVFINGHDVSQGMQTRNGCPARGNFVFKVADSYLQTGSNLLAVRARDTGGMAYLDMMVSGASGQEDNPTDELIEFFQDLPTAPWNPDDLIVDGDPSAGAFGSSNPASTPPTNSELTEKLRRDLTRNAFYFTQKANFRNPCGKPANTNPRQNGLAYSYGQRNACLLSYPPVGECKSKKVYGLDCSGLVLSALRRCHFPFRNATADKIARCDPDSGCYLQDLVDAHPVYKGKVYVTEKGPIDAAEFKSGDIIWWKKENGEAMHIGVVGVFGDSPRLRIAQSAGTHLKRKNCEGKGCERNWGPKGGPRVVDISDIMNWQCRPKCTSGSCWHGYGITRFEPVEECPGLAVSGADAPETRVYDLKKKSGTFVFSYNTYTIKDRMVVRYENRTLLDTSCVGESGTKSISYSGKSTIVTISVEPDCAAQTGTRWDFSVSCPH